MIVIKTNNFLRITLQKKIISQVQLEFMEILNFYFIEHNLQMSLPRKFFQNRTMTHRKQQYRLPTCNKSIERKNYNNLTSQLVSPPHKNILRLSNSIKTLKSHRDTTLMSHNITIEIETPKNMESIARPLNIFNYIHITLDLGAEEIKIKSHAQSVVILLQELKKTMVKKHKKYRPFVLQSAENNCSLSYFLSQSNSKIQSLWGKNIKIKPYYLTPQVNVDINSFEIIRCIGAGGFSKVFLGRYKANGQFYAMKMINKSFIQRNKKHKLIINERNTLVETSHPLHAKLHWSFQSKNYLIFVMDYYPGGQLFNLLKKYRKMPEQIAKFYIMQILLAIESLHNEGIAYRDLKPENILLDKEGHIHLADFGLAKPGFKFDGTKTYSFCGSPQYMPPEIVGRKGHSLSVDFYSLGALLYELVTGLPPFYNNDAEKIYNATLKQPIQYLSSFSSELTSLLQGLLCKEEQYRLGSTYGAREIFEHPWFNNMNPQDFANKKIEPPFKFDKYEDIAFPDDIISPHKEKALLDSLRQEQDDRNEFVKMFDNFDFALSRNSEASTQIRQSLNRVKTLKPFKKIRLRTQQNSNSNLLKSSKVNNYL